MSFLNRPLNSIIFSSSTLAKVLAVGLISAIYFTSIPIRVLAADGDLDATFITTDRPGSVPAGVSRIQFPNGAANSAAGSDAGSESPAFVGMQSDGRSVAVLQSSFSGTGKISLVRLNTNGTIDSTFGGAPGGKVNVPVQTPAGPTQHRNPRPVKAVMSGDKIVILGTVDFGVADGGSPSNICQSGMFQASDVLIVMVNADGTLDTGFDGDGQLRIQGGTCNDNPFGIGLQTDGKIIVGETATDVGLFNAMDNSNQSVNSYYTFFRLNTDGTLDTTYDTETAHDPTDDGMAKHRFSSAGLPAQTLDPTLPNNELGASDLRVVQSGPQQNNAILFGGGNHSGHQDFMLNRITTNGAVDTTFAGGAGFVKTHTGDAGQSSSAIQGLLYTDGTNRVLAGGTATVDPPPAGGAFPSETQFSVVRYSVDGVSDAATTVGQFVVTPGSPCNNLSVQKPIFGIDGSGKIILGGQAFCPDAAYSGGTAIDMVMARLTSTLALDAGFGSGGRVITHLDTSGGGTDFAVQPAAGTLQTDGKILATGSLNVAFAGEGDMFVARFENSAAPPVVCDTIYALTTSNSFFTFNPATPGTTTAPVAITGLAAGETVQAIDFRPANGALYGMVLNLGGSMFRVVTINPATGATTAVGGFSANGGGFFGFDFNPVVDRIRIVSDSENNMRVDPDTGAVTVDTNLNPGNPNVVGSAYNNNFAGTPGTTLYGIDTGTDMLVIQNPPNAGTLINVGALGVNSSAGVGFDISQCGTAYASLLVGGTNGLYTIDVTTGAATAVGAIGSGAALLGIAVELAPLACAPNANIIVDGGFEANTDVGTNPNWTSTSTLFGSSLCTVAGCGIGGGSATPRAGNGWVWFDGTGSGGAAEAGTAVQTRTIPVGTATLSYFLRIGAVTAPSTSTLIVRVDGTAVQTITEPAAAEAAYTQRTVDISAFADGGSHAISFNYSRPAGTTGSDNFTIDDVTLSTACPTATQDFGDAPTAAQSGFAASYPTTLADNGARHTATGPMLGATRDSEADGQPNATATGDGADEDGVTFGPIVAGANMSVTINTSGLVGTAPVSLRIDFNRDGDWNDAGEHPLNGALVGAGGNIFPAIPVPAGASPGTSFARVRLATTYAEIANPTGLASDGEVEDYQVTIAADNVPPVITCPANITATAAAGTTTAAVTYPPPVATDNVGVVTLICNPPSGSVFPAGTTTVTCTATDAAMNTATCTFTITVLLPPQTVVDDDGMGTFADCNALNPTFNTIQGGVNGVAVNGTVKVCPGVYPELVTVNKTVTINGAQMGVDARTRPGTPALESVVTGNAGSTSFYVTSSDVTIDGFTVQGNTNPNLFGAGIFVSPGTNGTDLINNIIQNNIIGIFPANNSAVNQATIRRNLIRNNNNAGPASGHGIYSDQFSAGGALRNVLIDNNRFSGNSGQGIGFSSTDAAQPQTAITISNNEFVSNGRCDVCV